MKTIFLPKEKVHVGNLILVNREYGYEEKSEDMLMPVQNEFPRIIMRRRAAVLLASIMGKIHGWQDIVPVSGFRSLKEQQEIWDDSLKNNGREFTEKYVAYPGHSEHQTGLAIDLGLKQEVIDFIRPDFPYTGICQAFRDKAWEYGFVERYPKEKERVTGIGHEPWHFRYVGIPHAAIMAEKNLVLEEYISFIRQFPYGQSAYCYRGGGRDIQVSYLEASAGNTSLTIDAFLPYSVSGDNVKGFIITQWRDVNE